MAEVQSGRLGKRLRQERELRHWTQEQLAELIGRSVPSINRWEHDRAEPQPDALKQLTELFGKPPDRWGTSRWNVPFLRNPYFTGREQLLLSLHRPLAAGKTGMLGQIRAISGLGGIGKTQTAIEYAYRYAREYEAVLWVQADSHELLVSDFARLAQIIDLSGKEDNDQWRIVNAVKHWLQEHSGWLLILDNADDLAVLTDFLPRGVGGATLVTTRSQITGKIARNISVEKMEVSEGVRFVLRRARLLEEDEPLETVSAATRTSARQLVAELDGLPLALDQAGAYIEETGCSLSEYLALYAQHGLALFKPESSSVGEYPHTVASTWMLSFSQVEQANPAAADVLRVCAFLHPDAIPEAILTAGAAALGPHLQNVANEPLLLNEAIRLLRRYSLVKRDAEAKLLNMHRLVQVVLKESMDIPTRQQWAERAMLAVNAVFPHEEPETWAQCERLLPHAFLGIQFIEAAQIVSEEAGRLLHEVATYLSGRARYAESEALYQRALRIRELRLGPDHLDVAKTCHNLAYLYRDMGKYTEAEPLFQRALRIFEQALGAEHSFIATVSNNLAILYLSHRNYAKAKPLYQRALRIFEQAFGPESAEVTNVLNNLAELAYEQGDYAEAESLFQRDLRIFEQTLGPEYPHITHPLRNLAVLYTDQGKYTEAEPLFQRALRISEQQLGSEHPDTADIIHLLARFWQAQGNSEDARSCYTRALVIREKTLGAHHPATTETRNCLIILLHAMGQHEKAARHEAVQPEQDKSEEERKILSKE